MSLPEQTPTFLPDWQSAELAAVAHMRSIGFIDAQKTQDGADGGIDVESSEAAAQVKFYANPVGRPDIQRLLGAAHEYRIPVFYSTGGYTKEAMQYANRAGVALFKMDPYGLAEPCSEPADVLTAPDQVQERQERLEELKAVRYRYAAASFKQDVELYAEFGRQVKLSDDHSPLFTHVLSDLERAVQSFWDAVEQHQFESADRLFQEINNRIGFLAVCADPELPRQYESFEQAVSNGWSLGIETDSEPLLYRISSGALELNELVLKYRETCRLYLHYEDDYSPYLDIDLQADSCMLLSLAIDQSILSEELLIQLTHSVRVGVHRVHNEAIQAFKRLANSYNLSRNEIPTRVIAGKLRVDALAGRILRQLDAS